MRHRRRNPLTGWKRLLQTSSTPTQDRSRPAPLGSHLFSFPSLRAVLLPESFKPGQRLAKAGDKAAEVIQFRRRARIHEPHATRAAISEALVADDVLAARPLSPPQFARHDQRFCRPDFSIASISAKDGARHTLRASAEADTRSVPSGVNARAYTGWRCPFSVRISCAVCAS